MGLVEFHKKQKAKKNEAKGKGAGHRYSATVQKDESVWKQEWSGFMSGVSLKTVKDGTNKIVLQSSKDLLREAENEENNENSEIQNYSYLFNSPAEKKAARKLTKDKNEKKKNASVSRHQSAVVEAEKLGLQLEGMSRKEKRKFLQLSAVKNASDEEEGKKDGELKPYELMDPKLAWYQQGPFPIDVISEKLVRKKAEKKGKQLGLRYNYLLPHPSWIAKRCIRRRESFLAPMGKRTTFDEDGREVDPLASLYPDLSLTVLYSPSSSASQMNYSALGSAKNVMDDLLLDPVKAASYANRKVVRNKEAAALIHRANLSTNFLSSSLIKGKASDGL